MRGGEEKDMTIRLLENENGSPSTTLAPRSFRTLMHSTSLFTSHYITLHYVPHLDAQHELFERDAAHLGLGVRREPRVRREEVNSEPRPHAPRAAAALARGRGGDPDVIEARLRMRKRKESEDAAAGWWGASRDDRSPEKEERPRQRRGLVGRVRRRRSPLVTRRPSSTRVSQE